MISGIITAVLMIAFLCITYWAYSARNRHRFDDAAQMPLRDEDTAVQAGEGRA
ncbi:MAG: cbb3-type cytochrome c oxidase subunit 3 [Nevskiales bacterium]|nr:cbb3-type cytochrome c oxidase subunit 3 [Nevskiales bacterium]